MPRATRGSNRTSLEFLAVQLANSAADPVATAKAMGIGTTPMAVVPTPSNQPFQSPAPPMNAGPLMQGQPQPLNPGGPLPPVMPNEALGQRDFGPGLPLPPRYGPGSPEWTGPRTFHYPFGYNLVRPPRTELPDLTAFAQLKNLARLYSFAAICIAVRIEEMQALGHGFSAKNKKDQRALQDVCQAAESFWDQPDGVTEFPSWLAAALRDVFELDALSIYPHNDLGGRLSRLELVAGDTIKPLLDDRGRVGGYQQIIHGYPASQYQRDTFQDQDLAPDEQLPIYAPDELIYRPRWPRNDSPYGSPPGEWIILSINFGLRKQMFDIQYYVAGNIPDMIAWPPKDQLNPDQVALFEEQFNAVLEGNDAARRKIHFLPWAADLKELRPFSFETKLDEWLMRQAGAAYGVPPHEMGFTMDVNKASAEMQEAVNERRGLGAVATWFKHLIDAVTRRRLDPVREGVAISRPGQPTQSVISPFSKIEFQWHYGDTEDKLKAAQTHNIDIKNGVLDPDESREMRYGEILQPRDAGVVATGPAVMDSGARINPAPGTPALPAPAPQPQISPAPIVRVAKVQSDLAQLESLVKTLRQLAPV